MHLARAKSQIEPNTNGNVFLIDPLEWPHRENADTSLSETEIPEADVKCQLQYDYRRETEERERKYTETGCVCAHIHMQIF